MPGASLLLAGLLAAGTALAAEPKVSKSQVSSDGKYAVRLFELGEKACRLEVVQDTSVAWQLEKCFGTADDLYFVSNDGARFWVLYPLPEKPARARGKMIPWFRAVVAVEFDRSGAALSSRRLIDFVGKRQLEKMRQLERHFKWLAGAAGEDGKGPRINDQNQIEFDTLGSTKTTRLSF